MAFTNQNYADPYPQRAPSPLDQRALVEKLVVFANSKIDRAKLRLRALELAVQASEGSRWQDQPTRLAETNAMADGFVAYVLQGLEEPDIASAVGRLVEGKSLP